MVNQPSATAASDSPSSSQFGRPPLLTRTKSDPTANRTAPKVTATMTQVGSSALAACFLRKVRRQRGNFHEFQHQVGEEKDVGGGLDRQLRPEPERHRQNNKTAEHSDVERCVAAQRAHGRRFTMTNGGETIQSSRFSLRSSALFAPSDQARRGTQSDRVAKSRHCSPCFRRSRADAASGRASPPPCRSSPA